jgi:signal transduction histidine kinase
MASLGTLVKGISHELNTPLGNALTSVSQTEHLLWVLSEQFNEGQLTKTEFEKTVGIAQDNLTVALRNISRTTNLINQFKELSDAQEVDEKMPIHLDEFLNETADFFNQAQRKNGLQFKIDVHEQCRTLNVYLGSFSRAVRHIYANAAIHAYDNSGKGKMVITATPTTITGRPFTVISFTDFGKGLDDQQLAMFFDPFFTSNRQKGAGLGTSIIYNLITHQLKGKVNVERNPEGGITVQLCLPNLPSPEAIKE